MEEAKLLDYLEDFISEERRERFISVLANRTKFITVALEDVFQMHNTSAVIRSCDVFGIQEAHLIQNRNANELDKNIAMGAQQWVDVYRYKDTTDCITALKTKGYKIIATTPHDNSLLLHDFEVDEKIALFFGTERDGLTQAVLEQADGFLKIPMKGFTESLNISVAAAIILQNLSTKLMQTKVPWQLTEAEKLEKRLEWTKKSIKSIDKILERYHTKA
ncbi:TrmH family RNA methyltransferase [Maribacter chungangensis]|uniref:tRNA (guanosine(18)-2'-O)-methyltransferase n=1 Tax=Maribacter chungangensis TaxID=1069117 RepID=A0ABW3B339_9FLAO